MKLIIAIVLVAVIVGYGYHKFDELTRPLPVPKIDNTKYWGPGDGSKYKADNTIRPFKIHYDEEVGKAKFLNEKK